MKRDLYTEVSARIVAELERGAAPWVKPWSATAGQNVPQNAISNRPYSGVNVVLLWLARDRGWATPRFLTFKQAVEAGGHVRKGEHGTKVYFVKQLQVRDGEGEEAEVSNGVRLGPLIGIQKGPPDFALGAISARAVGAGRGCGDGASAGC